MLTLGFIFETCSAVGAILWFLLTIYVLVKILSSSASGVTKILWIIAIFCLPILGPILWLLLGDKK